MIEELISYHHEDFNVWISERPNDVKYYNLSIEGYIGYEKLEDCIELYNEFKDHLHEYLITNDIERPENDAWQCIYQSRAIEICYEHDCYWVFLDAYKSVEIWDLYYYLDDVIKQIQSNAEKIMINRMLKR
ncbi:hypothetical protein D3C73_185360 [compost metagenome]